MAQAPITKISIIQIMSQIIPWRSQRLLTMKMFRETGLLQPTIMATQVPGLMTLMVPGPLLPPPPQWIGGVTPAAVTDDDAGTATIDTLTAPSTTGSYEFTVKTAISGGTLTTMRSTQPTVFVSIGAGAVVINEIAWMGTLHDSGHEWIELYNTTASDISIEDWSICGADTAETLNFSAADSGSTTVPANGYLLYAEDSTVFSSGIPVGVNKLYDSTIGLNNTSPGQIILYEALNGTKQIINTRNGQ